MDVPRGTLIIFKINHYCLIIVSRGTRLTKELNAARSQTPIDAIIFDGFMYFLLNQLAPAIS